MTRVKTCKDILLEIRKILQNKDELTSQDVHKIREIIREFLSKRFHITITLEKFEQLCSTACYNPEMLLENRKSKCIRVLEQIREKLTSIPAPVPRRVIEGIIELIDKTVQELENRYSRISLRRFREILEDYERLRRRVQELEVENRQLRGRVVSLYEEREVLRRRVHSLSERVRVLEGELQYLRQGLDTYVLQGKKLDRILTDYSRLVEEELNYLTIIARYRTLYETYLSLTASLANTVSRLLEENAALLSMVSRLREEVEHYRDRVRELEERLRLIEEIIRTSIPEKVRRRIVEEVRRSMLQ